MNQPYEMNDQERELFAKVRKALEYEDNGDPAKDAIDEREMIAAMRLLVEIVEAGYVI